MDEPVVHRSRAGQRPPTTGVRPQPESPWAQPPQRTSGPAPDPVSTGAAPPHQPGTAGLPQSNTARATQPSVAKPAQPGVAGQPQAGVAEPAQPGVAGQPQAGVTGQAQAGVTGQPQAGVAGQAQSSVPEQAQVGTAGTAQSGAGPAGYGPVPDAPRGVGPVPSQPAPVPVPPAPVPPEPGPLTSAHPAEPARPRLGPLPPTFNPPGPLDPTFNPPGPLPPPYRSGPPAQQPAPPPGPAAQQPAPPPGPAAQQPGSPSDPSAQQSGAPSDPATQQPGPPPGPLSPGLPGPSPRDPAGWYPPPWQHGTGQHGTGQPGTPQAGPAAYPDSWSAELAAAPTAEDFARRRQLRPPDPVAATGFRAMVNKTGLVKLPPGRHEQELRRDIEMVRRNFGGLRQVTVVNPKGGAGKTVAILLLAMTFGQKRGGYVLAWDNNETQGTLGMRAQQDFHSRTVRDMLRDLGQFQGAHGRVGDLSQYVRSQGEGMFDVLASDESATGGEMLTAAAFAEIRDVVSRFYKLIFVDTGNNVRAQNWQAAMDATDQLLVTMSARNDSAETAARMLDHLEQSGRQRLVRQAVTVVSMPPSRKEIDLPAIQQHFAARTRAVLLAPYERLIDSGEPIRYGGLSAATRDAWLKIAASVAEGL
ncbi:MinD/ParA family ATP-binding protein [Micromonospora yangpuensis]|uniref:MinD/ParA family ATP-binding protein n=1 Tax=Micromonospora yangpuensis TaxID=683228 RepID=UPI003CC7F0A5